MQELLKVYIVKDANRVIKSIHRNEQNAINAKASHNDLCCDKCPFYYIEAYIVHDSINNDTQKSWPAPTLSIKS